MKITISKNQWEFVGKKAGWMKTAQEMRYYLETYVDGKEMLGSDGTSVLKSVANLQQKIQNRIEILRKLSVNIKPHLNDAKNIKLKLVDNNNRILKEFDVTFEVQNF